MNGTMVRPPASDDRTWVLKKLIFLALVMIFARVPFDLSRYGIIVPAGRWVIAYGVFEVTQAVVFGILIFYSDLIPGIRTLRRYFNLTPQFEMPSKTSWRIVVQKLICFIALMYAINEPFDILQHAAPAGDLRFCAATAYFIVSRVTTILSFYLLVDDSNDDPKQRRRRIAKAVVDRFRIARGPRAPAPVTVPVTRCAAAPSLAFGPALRLRV